MLEADIVFKAIGQKMLWDHSTTPRRNRRAEDRTNCLSMKSGRTSLPGVWAGGDCVFGGEDLTVSAVQDGKLAALSIDRF